MKASRAQVSAGKALRWIGTLAAIVLLILLLRRQGWEQIRLSVEQIGFQTFLAAAGLVLVSRLMMVGRWYVLVQHSDVGMPFEDALRLTFVGLFANNFLPSTVGGDVVRLAGAVQAGYDGAVASLIVDRLVGMAGMALALPIGLQQTFPSAANHISSPLAFAGLAPSGLLKLWEKGRAFLQTFTGQFVEALKLWLRHPQALLFSLAFSLGHMACLFGAFWLLLEAMNDFLPYWLIAGLWSIVYFITLVPVSINGLGVMEVTIAFAFTTLGGAGEASSLILALSYRTLIMLTSLPGAAFIGEVLPGARQESGEE